MKDQTTGLIYASTFLSHSSVDYELVSHVARELCRRGVIPWLDRNELSPGENLLAALRSAIRRQATVAVFLSPSSAASSWVRDELSVITSLEKEVGGTGHAIPIYIGDPYQLVASHSLLRSRWLHPDGDRVDRLGIGVDPENEMSDQAVEIAEKLSCRVYEILETAKKQELVICLDQRGDGKRKGIPNYAPDNLNALDAPALVFRPAMGTRRSDETLVGAEWQAVWGAMKTAVSEALNGTRWPIPKKIRILGNSQLAFPFFLGCHFDRNSSAHLYCAYSDGTVFNNKSQPKGGPLAGGDPDCATFNEKIHPIPEGARVDTVHLLLLKEYLVSKALAFIDAVEDDASVVWVNHGKFESSEDVMDYTKNVVALLIRLGQVHGVRSVRIFLDLPFHAVPLLAANLLNIVDNIVFMENRKDLQGSQAAPEEMYAPLSVR